MFKLLLMGLSMNLVCRYIPESWKTNNYKYHWFFYFCLLDFFKKILNYYWRGYLQQFVSIFQRVVKELLQISFLLFTHQQNNRWSICSYLSNSPKNIPMKKITDWKTYGFFVSDMLYSSMEIPMEWSR